MQDAGPLSDEPPPVAAEAGRGAFGLELLVARYTSSCVGRATPAA